MWNHVFGGVSSGACSNLTLKVTAIENKEEFGEEATQTLQNNFYVDNLLKSVENEDMAVQLIRLQEGYRNVPGSSFQFDKVYKQQQKGSDLESVHMKRYFIPPIFGKVKDCSRHYLSDTCEKGYGQVTYLCAVDEIGKVHCSLVMGKARVAPLKYITIPRMELLAATPSVKVSVMLWKGFQFPITRDIFWTDSEAVLGYIRNHSRKFKVFVAN